MAVSKRGPVGEVQFSLYVPAALVARLDEIAARRGATRSAVAREALLDWLGRQDEAEKQD